MRLLVRIDHTGDVTPFCRATQGRRIDEVQLHNPWQAAWIRDALVTFAHPDGATFFVVEAPGEASLRRDVESANRYLHFPDGEPRFVVLATES
jgi:hypothetical protein